MKTAHELESTALHDLRVGWRLQELAHDQSLPYNAPMSAMAGEWEDADDAEWVDLPPADTFPHTRYDWFALGMLVGVAAAILVTLAPSLL